MLLLLLLLLLICGHLKAINGFDERNVGERRYC